MKTTYSIHIRSQNPERSGLIVYSSDYNKILHIFNAIKADNENDEVVMLRDDFSEISCTPLQVK